MGIDLNVFVVFGVRLNTEELNLALAEFDPEGDYGSDELLQLLDRLGVPSDGIELGAAGSYWTGKTVEYLYNWRTAKRGLTDYDEPTLVSLADQEWPTAEESQDLLRVARELGQSAPKVEPLVAVLWS